MNTNRKKMLSLNYFLSQKEEEIIRLKNSRKELEDMYTNLKWLASLVFRDNEPVILNKDWCGFVWKSTSARFTE